MDQDLLHIIKGCVLYDAKQQEALYKYCYTQMFAVCERYSTNRDEAASLYNEAMLKILTKINTYDHAGAFMGWARKIMVNTCIDHCRKKIKYTTQALDEKYEEAVFVESSIETKISSELVIKLIQSLPKNTSLVFNLYVVEGYKLEEIATALNITLGTTKWHISEARKTLRQKLQQHSTKVINANA